MSRTVDESRLRGPSFVVVVQTAEVTSRDDRAVGRRRDGSRHRRILVQRQVRPTFQVIRDVRTQGAAQSAFIGDNDVVEALATNRPDQPLRVGVLPRRSWSREDVFDPECRGRRRPCVARRIPIANQISWRLVPRKSFAQLLRGPRRRGTGGDGDVDDPPAFVREDYQHEQKPASRRWDDDEIGGCDLLEVVRQERAPGLRRRCVRTCHVFRDRGLRHVDAQLQELAMNPWRSTYTTATPSARTRRTFEAPSTELSSENVTSDSISSGIPWPSVRI